ncbi:DUF1134 domain-containing protein [Erythrobacter sp.]|uniref:DUF1134 domain-containing protein n=1 Tax=Erythrobacter sp. TaxID=1042 RepID=UPI002ECCDDC2|nr:DUF1134 domain-containing protein [Erythrobacter sp.]
MKKQRQTDGKTRISRRSPAVLGAFVAALFSLALPAGAQDVERFDPDEAYAANAAPAQSTRVPAPARQGSDAIDGDLAQPDFRAAPPIDPAEAGSPQTAGENPLPYDVDSAPADDTAADWSDPANPAAPDVPVAQSATYAEDDLIGAAEGVFGKGAKGLAGLIEDLLREQGEPNGYIVGREAGGAFVFGARYGSGTLHHKIEGERPVYWTGPSLGLDAGANAGSTFVLVYNLYDSEDLFRRYPAGEGQAYFVGGLHASYMRRGDIVLIPIRMGAGLRLGVNAGYMRFSQKQRWLPF